MVGAKLDQICNEREAPSSCVVGEACSHPLVQSVILPSCVDGRWARGEGGAEQERD